MYPLNFAILKYFTTVDSASVDNVMDALRPKYGNSKAFKKKEILSALMTAKENALLEEESFEFDANNELVIYYRANEDGAATINSYIK